LDSTTQIMTLLIVLTAGASSLILTQFARRRQAATGRRAFAVRALPAIDAVPGLIGMAIEAGRPIHVSLGSSGLGGGETAATLASAVLFTRVAERAATGSVAPLLTMSDASALPLGYQMMRRAYVARGRLDRYERKSVRWLPTLGRPIAFAAGLTIMAGNEQVAGNVLTGSFGAELALILFSAQRRRQMTIAGSDQLAGMAVAYAMADEALLGEEIFAAPAYLSVSAARKDSRSDETGRRAALIVTDVLRWLLIAALLIAVVNQIRQPVFEGIARILAQATVSSSGDDGALDGGLSAEATPEVTAAATEDGG